MLPSDRANIKLKPTSWIVERWKYYMTKDEALILGKEATRRLIELENRIKRGELHE